MFIHMFTLFWLCINITFRAAGSVSTDRLIILGQLKVTEQLQDQLSPSLPNWKPSPLVPIRVGRGRGAGFCGEVP